MIRKRAVRISKVKFLLISFIFLLIITVALFLVFGGIKLFFAQKIIGKVFAPRKVILSISQIYSKSVQETLKFYIQNKLGNKDFSDFDVSSFYKDLKSEFKFIRKIEWNINNPDFANLKIIGITPLYLVNDEWILGNKKRLFKKELFNELNLENLRNVFVGEKYLGHKLNEFVYDFLQEAKLFKHWDKFNVTYFDFSNIELAPKNLNFNYLLRLDESNFFDSKKIDFVDLNFDDLKKEKFMHPRKKDSQKIVYDLRFKDRIYVKSSNARFIKNKRGGGGNVG